MTNAVNTLRVSVGLTVRIARNAIMLVDSHKVEVEAK